MKKCIIITLIFISNIYSQTQITGSIFWGLYVDRQTDAVYSANNMGSGFVIKSTDLGDSWQILANQLDGNTYSLVYTPDGSIITASGSYAYRIAAGSFNNFISELEYTFTISTFLDQSGNIYIGNCVFGGSTGSLYRSSDDGISWNKFTSLSTVSLVKSMLFTTNRIYLGTQDNGIYYSSDDGNSWEACNEGLPFLKSPSIAKTSDNTLFAIVQTDNYSNAYLYKSTDLGAHWIQASNYIINGYVAGLFISSADVLFCNENESILYSSDNGVNWINKDVGSEIYNFAETSTGILIASGDYGIFISEDNGNSWEYKQITNTTVNTKTLKKVDRNYNLYDNYPNPFNPRTIIRFSLAYPGFVIIDVYDLLGRKVKNLINGYTEAGIHEVEFDAENLPSGEYIYRIRTGKYENSKKMILMK